MNDSHPLPDLVHVLGQYVVHVPQVRGQELLLGFSSWNSRSRWVFLLLTVRQMVDRYEYKTKQQNGQWQDKSEDKSDILERDNGRGSTDVSSYRVQDLHGILQLQLLIQSHNTGLSTAVPDQDPPQKSIIENHKSEIWKKGFKKLINTKQNIITCASSLLMQKYFV